MGIKLTDMRRLLHTVRFPLVALVFAGWLVASNHCALSSLIGAHSENHICCKKEPATQTGKSCSEKCCKALSVPIPKVQALPGGPSCDGLLAFQDQPSDMAWTLAARSCAVFFYSAHLGFQPSSDGSPGFSRLIHSMPATMRVSFQNLNKHSHEKISYYSSTDIGLLLGRELSSHDLRGFRGKTR